MTPSRLKSINVATSAFTVASLAVGLCGCSPAASLERAEPEAPPTTRDTRTPTFTGPWAGDLTDAYSRSDSRFERSALEDGIVSDSEFAEMTDRFDRCLADGGVVFGGFDAGGGFDFSFSEGASPSDANATADDCSQSTGNDTVGSMYFQMQRNPLNLSESTIIADCLVRSSMVPPTYDADDFERDSVSYTFPFPNRAEGDAAYAACVADPLGLFGQTQ